MDKQTRLIINIEWDKEAKSGKMLGAIGESELPWTKAPDPIIMIKITNAVVRGPAFKPRIVD